MLRSAGASSSAISLIACSSCIDSKVGVELSSEAVLVPPIGWGLGVAEPEEAPLLGDADCDMARGAVV